MLEKIASLRPFPIGVVFQQDPRVHHDIPTIRAEFALIRRLGFNALKQVMLSNRSAAFARAVFEAAIEEGLIPWWYGRAGWEAITPELLNRIGIPSDTLPAAVQNDSRMLAYQK